MDEQKSLVARLFAPPPKNWPAGVKFLATNHWSDSIPLELLAFYVPKQWPPPPQSPASAATPPPTHTPFPVKEATKERRVSVKKITDPSHPAFGQCGLFAATALAARTHILDYVGQVRLAADASETSDYILSFDRVTGLSLDAEFAGGEGRFCNDFRGVCAKANVEFDPYRDSKTGQVKMGIWVLAKDIKKGDELCVSYGKGWWRERGLIS
ncbi:hypothetical protein HDU87_005593 [Geranomyces variabilis]|uniref:SET domain-containing protein n=1 Tax=Geranomyces variabilis TaxID=109894 RepID=A0AAD5TGJ3_9FUNG|nr:hypothetical protein HDU87_005593 [Geranomyces variabilis]